jgi:hypothetical protein
MERDYVDLDYARGKVFNPAIILTVVSAICIGCLWIGLAFDVWFILSDAAVLMEYEAIKFQFVIRSVWSVAMMVANSIILAGALRMRNLRSRGLARGACILALIPCLGPCFVLGIPFGIWGLVVLKDPQVSAAFEP